MKKSWYCYLCGNKLKKAYFLISMANSTDRLFLCCEKEKCISQVDQEEVIISKVREET